MVSSLKSDMDTDSPICHKTLPEWSINVHLDSGCVPFTQQNSDTPAPQRTRPSSSPKELSQSRLFDSSPTPSTSTSQVRHGPKRPREGPGPQRLQESHSFSGADRKPTQHELMTAQKAPQQSFSSVQALHNAKPFAERIRPRELDDIVGQQHLLGKGMLLRNMIERDQLVSMLLWGPPGTGKTTLARVISNTTKAAYRELSATSTKIDDVRKVFDEATNVLKLTGKRTVLFIDEVQRFTKSQQDIFLPFIEAGLITCIFATTENPSFRIQSALLSRCRVFTMTKLSVEECQTILERATDIYKGDDTTSETIPTRNLDSSLLSYIARVCDGDARVALQALDMAFNAGDNINTETLKEALRKAHLQYDRAGDFHYDTISALHKSVRGSDANATLYWLARMLESGEDPLYVARRMVRMAAEDIGLADPAALQIALAAYQSSERIGMPECDVILAQCAVYLAEAPKSVRVYEAYNRAKALVSSQPAYPVPLHIRNAPTGLMKDLGYGKEYRYEPSYAHPIIQNFMPPELKNTTFLKDDADLSGRTIDKDALEEWEKEMGVRWSGRSHLKL